MLLDSEVPSGAEGDVEPEADHLNVPLGSVNYLIYIPGGVRTAS